MSTDDMSLQREQVKALLVQRVESASTARSSIISICDSGAGIPLFCLHGGGAGLPAYQRLASYVVNHPCYGLQIEGAGVDDPVLTSVQQIAQLHLRSLLDYSFDGPYNICGHSMGATVAVELGTQLVEHGKQVSLVIGIDQPGPDVRLSKRHWLYWQWAAISQLPWTDRWSYIREAMRFRCATSTILPTFIRQKFYSNKSSSESVRLSNVSASEYRRRMADAAMQAVRNYCPRPFDFPLILFRADSSSPKMHSDPKAGWGSVARAGVQVIEIPGHHMNIFSKPHIEVFGPLLEKCLRNRQ